MKGDKSKTRQELQRAEKSRWTHVGKILAERGPLRRGCFVTILRKCGKPNCHCATGERHPAKYLSIKDGGRTTMVYVPPNKELQVAKEAWRYRRLRQQRATLAKLSSKSLSLIDELTRVLESGEKISTWRKRKKMRKTMGKKIQKEQMKWI